MANPVQTWLVGTYQLTTAAFMPPAPGQNSSLSAGALVHRARGRGPGGLARGPLRRGAGGGAQCPSGLAPDRQGGCEPGRGARVGTRHAVPAGARTAVA